MSYFHFLFIIIFVTVISHSCSNRSLSTQEDPSQLQSIPDEEYAEEDFEKSVTVKNYNPENKTMDNCRLELTMELTYREKSKDSGFRTKNVSISGCKVEIQYTSFVQYPEESELIIYLNMEKEQEIIGYLTSNGLNMNVEEQQVSGGTGTSGTFILEVSTPFKTNISIHGKTYIAGSDDFVREEWGMEFIESRTNLKNKHYFSKADSFIKFLENL